MARVGEYPCKELDGVERASWDWSVTHGDPGELDRLRRVCKGRKEARDEKRRPGITRVPTGWS